MVAVVPVVLKLTTNPPVGAGVSRLMIKVPMVPPSTGLVPGAMVIFGVVLRMTETLLLLMFAVAKSDLPSPLKSPTVTGVGRFPTEKLVAVPKLPVPVPNSTETLLLDKFAVAKSDLPSPLKSPTVTE